MTETPQFDFDFIISCHGPFKITPFQRVVVTSGVGVGSLIHANALAVPGPGLFTAPTWAHVCDGAMISANPDVNPSLTILALAERAMGQIPAAQPGCRAEARQHTVGQRSPRRGDAL